MKYTSITNNFRGFNYQSDWDSYEDWVVEMVKEENGVREINWSILVFVHSGLPVMKYKRGGGVFKLNQYEEDN